MKIKVKKEFYDLQEGVFRNEGDEFEVSDGRFGELQSLLPNFVEKAAEGKAKGKKEVAANNELPI